MTLPHLGLDDLMVQATLLAYRFAGYALLNLADDAAILAFIFC
jgi:hypothetical protein